MNERLGPGCASRTVNSMLTVPVTKLPPNPGKEKLKKVRGGGALLEFTMFLHNYRF